MKRKVYEGKYGKLVVDFENKEVVWDNLDRELIAKDSYGNDILKQNIYKEILEQLLGEDAPKICPPKHPNQKWNGRRTEFGWYAIMEDGTRLVVDGLASFFYHPDYELLSFNHINRGIKNENNKTK